MSGVTTNVGVNSTTQLVNQIQVIAQLDAAQTRALSVHEDRLTQLESKTDTFSSGGSTTAKVAGGAAGLSLGAALLHQSSEAGFVAKLGTKIAQAFAPVAKEGEKLGKFKTAIKAVGEKIAQVATRIPNLGAAAAVATLGIATYAGVKIAGAISNKAE